MTQLVRSDMQSSEFAGAPTASYFVCTQMLDDQLAGCGNGVDSPGSENMISYGILRSVHPMVQERP